MNDYLADVLPPLAGLSAVDRLAAARESAGRLGKVLDSIAAGELDASPLEQAALRGAHLALSMLTEPDETDSPD